MGSISIKRNKLAAPAPKAAKPPRSRRASATVEVLSHNGLSRYQEAFHEWEAVVGYSPGPTSGA
jgi:hypothetical protein